MIVIGGTITGIRTGIEGSLITGEITIETIGGTDDLGIIVPYRTVTWIDIGEGVIGEMIMAGGLRMDEEAEMDVEVLTDVMVGMVGGAGMDVAALVIETESIENNKRGVALQAHPTLKTIIGGGEVLNRRNLRPAVGNHYLRWLWFLRL
jgi:hypothetical protein